MTSPNLIKFNVAQTFYIDPATVAGQTNIKISTVKMYFKYKPAAVGNRSGINNPGVTIYLTDTIYGVPAVNDPKIYQQLARAEWNQIVTSSDASAPTVFEFINPVTVKPGNQYAIVIAFDGNEVFWPWTAKNGEYIVGTETLYNGATNEFIGKYYEYNSRDIINDTYSTPVGGYDTAWTPLDDTKLKFDVYATRYFISGTPICNAVTNTSIVTPASPIRLSNLLQSSDGPGHLRYEFPSQCMEQVTFSISNSVVQSFIGAQKVYQHGVWYPGGMVEGGEYISVATDGTNVVTANSLYPNGAAFDWADVYSTYTGLKYIVLQDTNVTNVRKIRSIVNSSVIVVDEPVTFTNAAAKFMISPVATIDGMATNSPRGKKTEFLWLTHSNANSTVRFVNNCIEAVTVAAGDGGSGYDNTDVLYVKGFQNVANKVIGGYVAMGNIVTNSTGGIDAVYMSNLGCGFVNSAAIVAVVANSTQIGNTTANSSAGTGAVFVYTVGATLKTELTNNIFRNCEVVNLDVNDITPFFDVNKPAGTRFDLQARFQYYMVNDNTCYDGFAYYVYPTEGGQVFDDIQLLSRNKIIADKTPCFVSYSNEFVTPYSNGSINDRVSALGITSNNVVLGMNTYSNNDFICAIAEGAPTIEFAKYIINDDYTGEETNFGNAWAKHLTTRINFTRLSEDIRVYLTAYKPANTDIQVYARIQNSGDPDAFDDAEWTRLQLIDGTKMLSSLNKFDDYIDLTYGFQPYPNTDVTLAGVITTTNAYANVVGIGTTLDTDLNVNDMVRIYDPYFPETNFIVATVAAVNSETSITLDQAISSDVNPALVQPSYTYKIDKLGWVHQGYNNITFDNVVRYYNTSIIKYDGYDILQLKIVLLNTHLGHIPRIHDIRCVGLSA